MTENIITRTIRIATCVLTYRTIIALAILSVPIILLVNIIVSILNGFKLRECVANTCDDLAKLLDLVEDAFNKTNKLLKV